MNRHDLVAAVAAKAGVTQQDAARVLHAATDKVAQEILRGGSIRLFDLGTFRSVVRRPRVGRNPRTGTSFAVPQRLGVKFLPSAGLKRALAAMAALRQQ